MNKKGDKIQMKGYKDYQAASQLMSSVPTDQDFNPYDYIDQSYYKNTKRGRMAYQEDLAKLLYLAQINQEERMNEYNSPLEQANRMREAGLNPDLQGITNEPAANVAGYSGNPMDGVSTNLDTVGDVLGIISSVSNVALGIASGAMNFLSFDVKSTEDAVGLADAAFSFFGDASRGLSSMTRGDFGMSVDMLPLRNRQKRQLKSMYDSYRGTPGFGLDIFKYDTEKMKTKGNYARHYMDDKYNPNRTGIDLPYEMDMYFEAWKPYIDALNDEAISKLKASKSRSDYEQGKYTFQSGVAEREFDEATRDFEKTQRELWSTLRTPIMNVIKNFRELDFKSSLGDITAATLSAFVLQSLNI